MKRWAHLPVGPCDSDLPALVPEGSAIKLLDGTVRIFLECVGDVPNTF